MIVSTNKIAFIAPMRIHKWLPLIKIHRMDFQVQKCNYRSFQGIVNTGDIGTAGGNQAKPFSNEVAPHAICENFARFALKNSRPRWCLAHKIFDPRCIAWICTVEENHCCVMTTFFSRLRENNFIHLCSIYDAYKVLYEKFQIGFKNPAIKNVAPAMNNTGQ